VVCADPLRRRWFSKETTFAKRCDAHIVFGAACFWFAAYCARRHGLPLLMARTLLAVVLALLPVSHPFSLPARQARLPRTAQRAQLVVLQEIEPDEYIPGLDVDVRLPLYELL